MSRRICAVLLSLALAGCDEFAISKADVTKIAADQAAKAVAAGKAALVQPTLVQPTDEKGRYQIVHPAPSFPAMVLLDTATGQTWRLFVAVT